MDGDQFQLLGMVGLVCAAGVLSTVLSVCATKSGALAQWLRRKGPAIAGQLCLGATGLAALLAVVATQDLLTGEDSRLVFNPWMWAELGVGRPLPMSLQFDALAGVCASLVLVVAVFLHADAHLRGRSPGVHARLALATGGLLLTGFARSLWVAALGWHLVGGVAIACAYCSETTRTNRLAAAWAAHRRQRVTDLFLWAFIAAVGSVALSFDPLIVAALMQERSVMVTWSFAGISVAAVAAVVLLLACVRQMHSVAGGSTVVATFVRWLAGLGALILVCRVHAIIALAPLVLATAGVLGVGLALVLALIAQSSELESRGRALWGVHIGITLICLGVGAWVEAVVLHIVAGLIALARHRSFDHTVFRILAAVAWSVLLGRVWASGWARMSALTPGLNWLVCLSMPVIIVLSAHAYTNGRARGGRGLLGVGAVVVACGIAAVFSAVPGEFAWLERILGRVGGEAATFRGEYALGWLPGYYNAWAGAPTSEVGSLRLGFAAASLLLSLVAAKLPARLAAVRESPTGTTNVVPGTRKMIGEKNRVRVGLDRFGTRLDVGAKNLAQTLQNWAAAPMSFLALAVDGVENLLRTLFRRLGPGRRVRLQTWVFLCLALAGLVLASVYMHPRAIVLGPTRVHPIDLGGLHPDIASARRGGGQHRRTAPTVDARDMEASQAAKRALDQPVVREVSP